MGYSTILKKKDGTVLPLHSNTLNQIRHLREAQIHKLTGELDHVFPIKKDGVHWDFHLNFVAKKKEVKL